MQLKATTPFGWVVRGCIGLTLLGCIGSFVLVGFVSMLGVRTASSLAASTTIAKINAGLADSDVTTQAVATAAPQPTLAPASTDSDVSAAAQESDTKSAAHSALSLDETSAVVDLGKQLGELGQGLGEIGKLAKDYDTGDVWKVKMAAQVVRVQKAHEAIKKLEVPERVKPLKAAIVDATTDCNTAMDKITSGIDSNNAAELTEAAQLMQSCGKKITDAMPELQSLQQ